MRSHALRFLRSHSKSRCPRKRCSCKNHERIPSRGQWSSWAQSSAAVERHIPGLRRHTCPRTLRSPNRLCLETPHERVWLQYTWVGGHQGRGPACLVGREWEFREETRDGVPRWRPNIRGPGPEPLLIEVCAVGTGIHGTDRDDETQPIRGGDLQLLQDKGDQVRDDPRLALHGEKLCGACDDLEGPEGRIQASRPLMCTSLRQKLWEAPRTADPESQASQLEPLSTARRTKTEDGRLSGGQ
jgi:hypothetical protein